MEQQYLKHGNTLYRVVAGNVGLQPIPLKLGILERRLAGCTF